MADLRPLRGLRYGPAAGELGDVVAPPYDVISPAAQRALHERSPYNVVRLEYGLDEAGNGSRYERAAADLTNWKQLGVLKTETTPSFYLYEQEFEHHGRRYRRRSIIGRVRLEPWDAGIILPHEHTMSGPKEDRLRLLRATRTDVSPVFSLYRSDGGAAIAVCERAVGEQTPAEAIDSSGQRHRIWAIQDTGATEALHQHFADRRLYIADGHHRYETALAYCDERRRSASSWNGDEPENFILMALTAADDPGLLILPIHRLARPASLPRDWWRALSATFRVSEAELQGQAALSRAMDQLQAHGGQIPAFVLLQAGEPALLLQARDWRQLESLMPAGHAEAWRRLDVNVLQYGILEPLLGIDIEQVRTGGKVEFTESAEEAWQAVASGRAVLAFLLNPTRAEQVLSVADAGDRMPQKSTYFYPKLGTGLVLYGMEDAAPEGAPR